MRDQPPVPEHIDVLIVGAGISGIDAAYHLQRRCPGRSWTILEARDAIGGTWDLFRYPGIRSDSDMYTLGFPFRPWRGDRAIVDGAAIRAYVEDTARHYGIDREIRFGHKVRRADWSSAEARWTVEVEAAGDTRVLTASFLFLCSGYYDYDSGYRPTWPGEAGYRGRIVHPQHWPEDMDYRDKKIAVIGSGATAVTLVPALAERAAHVTMVQRSPSYIVSRPSRDGLAKYLGARGTRLKNALLGLFYFNRARKRPERIRALLLKMLKAELPEGYDLAPDFTPAYKVWDQRVCLVPDGDLFKALRDGRISIATGTIKRYTAEGLELESGRKIEADIVVAATGLNVKLFGGIALAVDGAPIRVADHVAYKGLMLSDVPNLALSFGYTNASWTLKCDLTSRYVCRLLNHMAKEGLAICTPRLPKAGVISLPMLDFTSGYLQRAGDKMPRRGEAAPWRLPQNYLYDLAALGFGSVTDAAMEFRQAED
jgi:monooxygenase